MHPLASVFDVTQWVQTGGLLILFLLMTVQCVGVPFPSEVIMPLAGYLVSAGHLGPAGAAQGVDLLLVIVLGVAGNVVGSLLAYWLAAWLGEPVLLGPGRYIGIRRHHVEIADRWFRRHGRAAVLLGRFLPVVRTYISFPAGLARMPLTEFTLYTTVGTIPWVTALALAGWAVGSTWNRISGPIQTAGIVLAILIVLAVIGWFVQGRRQQSRPAAAEPVAAARTGEGERG
ncbi:MAG TPA: DedA family protein [Candidatus Binatia bacterium]|nr:DedA family protein [Candidatus Binatia bacterium]